MLIYRNLFTEAICLVFRATFMNFLDNFSGTSRFESKQTETFSCLFLFAMGHLVGSEIFREHTQGLLSPSYNLSINLKIDSVHFTFL